MATVLIVDDDEETRTTMRLVLEDKGNEVLEAGGVEDGLLLAQANVSRLDRVFIDWRLRDGDGRTVVAWLHACPDFTGQMIACSCVSTGGGLLLAAGCHRALVKPFGADELLACVPR